MKSPCRECDLFKFTGQNTFPECVKCKKRKAYIAAIDRICGPGSQTVNDKTQYRIFNSKIAYTALV